MRRVLRVLVLFCALIGLSLGVICVILAASHVSLYFVVQARHRTRELLGVGTSMFMAVASFAGAQASWRFMRKLRP